MKLVFNAVDRNGHEALKNKLNDEKIKYKVEDDDAFKVSFRVNKGEANDFQMNMVNNVLGATIPGSFITEE